jgi:hypothetical protein
MVEFIAVVGLLVVYSTLWIFAIGSYLKMERSNTLRDVPRPVYVSLLVSLSLGYVVDVLFNMTYGTIYYRRIPKELLFSRTTAVIIRNEEQLARWEQPSTRYLKALRWKDLLNKIDPNHIV